jgi:hypothetical protein
MGRACKHGRTQGSSARGLKARAVDKGVGRWEIQVSLPNDRRLWRPTQTPWLSVVDSASSALRQSESRLSLSPLRLHTLFHPGLNLQCRGADVQRRGPCHRNGPLVAISTPLPGRTREAFLSRCGLRGVLGSWPAAAAKPLFHPSWCTLLLFPTATMTNFRRRMGGRERESEGENHREGEREREREREGDGIRLPGCWWLSSGALSKDPPLQDPCTLEYTLAMTFESNDPTALAAIRSLCRAATIPSCNKQLAQGCEQRILDKTFGARSHMLTAPTAVVVPTSALPSCSSPKGTCGVI